MSGPMLSAIRFHKAGVWSDTSRKRPASMRERDGGPERAEDFSARISVMKDVVLPALTGEKEYLGYNLVGDGERVGFEVALTALRPPIARIPCSLKVAGVLSSWIQIPSQPSLHAERLQEHCLGMDC